MIEVTFDRPIRKTFPDFPMFNEDGNPVFDHNGDFIHGSIDGGSRTAFVKAEDKNKAKAFWAAVIVDGERL